MAAPNVLGELLARDREVFRACTTRNFLNNPRTEIRDRAYYRKPKDTDGLSLGVTPYDAVHDLENWGVIGAPVDRIQDLPTRGLEVRADIELPGHALIHGLPYKHENEKLAEDIAWELVKISRIVYNDSYYPPGHRLHVPQAL
ncbi:MAG: hypothetical protein WAL89_14430 [Candidatus Sulfotelmatobacter sp.]|jgi:hypothetical protein